ncbi:hypothetical protein ACLOJK_009568 [Asimina triloba]
MCTTIGAPPEHRHPCSTPSKELLPNPSPARLRSTDRSRPLSTAGEIQTAMTHSIDCGRQLVDGGQQTPSSSPAKSSVTTHHAAPPSQSSGCERLVAARTATHQLR